MRGGIVMSPRWLPPRRFYRDPVIQGVAIFMALIGYGHEHDRIAWTLGGYMFGLAGMTLAWHQDRWEKLVRPHPLQDKLYADWCRSEYEVERLRRGLQQIVDGNFPADAINGETWAAEVLADSYSVEWDGVPTSRSPLAQKRDIRAEGDTT